MSTRVFSNWNMSFFSRPLAVANPTNLAELIAVVKDREKYPSPVRVGGHFHSVNDCWVTSGTQLLLDNFNDVKVDMQAGTITVGAHVDMLGIRDALRPHKVQLEVMPEIGNATAGSLAVCGTKDASLGPHGLALLSSTVTQIRLVNTQGEVETINAASDPDKLYTTRSCYGLFGVVFEVTFSIQQMVTLHYRYAAFKLKRLPDPETILGGAAGALGVMFPYSNFLLVERRYYAEPGEKSSLADHVKRYLRDKLWEHGTSFLNTLLPYNWFFYIFDQLVRLSLAVLDRSGGFVAWRADSMLSFEVKRRSYLDFTFWAIPLARQREWIAMVVKFCKDFERRTGFRCGAPAEVYFLKQDDRSLLSPWFDTDVFTTDFVDCRMNDPLWIQFNREFNELAADFGARPLLNQTKELTRSVMQRCFGERWDRFGALCRQYDPDGRFLSDFFKNLLPETVTETVAARVPVGMMANSEA